MSPGDRYGRLIVLSMSRANAFCRCDCGAERDFVARSIRYGRIKSCGCAHRERSARGFNLKHGHTKMRSQTPTYGTWRSMIVRCSEEKFTNYHGRGIKVCDRWSGEHGFENFLADMGERPDGCTIDRLNNDGHYEPGNCRWATRQEQGQRTSRVKLTPDDVVTIRSLVAQGQTKSDVGRRFGVSGSNVCDIVSRQTWRNIP